MTSDVGFEVACLPELLVAKLVGTDKLGLVGARFLQGDVVQALLGVCCPEFF